MKYWINRDLENNNVLILARNGLLVGSCNKEDCESVAQKFAKKTHPVEVLGKANVENITLPDITKLESRNTDNNLLIYHKKKKDEDYIEYEFEGEEDRQNCLSVIEKILPETYKKTQVQQSRLMAALPALLSLLLGVTASALYFNIFRWLTIVVGGIWLSVSVYMLYYRFTRPPEITRWLRSGRIIGRTWQAMKNFYAYLFVGAFIIGYSFFLPESYGSRAIVEHAEHGELDLEIVSKLIDRGADVNLATDWGDRPLHIVIDWEEYDLIPVLIENGADPGLANGDGNTPLMLAINANEEIVVNTLLESGKYLGDFEGLIHALVYTEFSLPTLSALFSRGINVNALNENGDNALKLAIYEGGSRVLIQFLVEKGVSANFTIEGKTPAEYVALERKDLLDLFAVHDIQSR